MDPRGDLTTRLTAIALAVLCVAAWLGTPWHLAFEHHTHAGHGPISPAHDHDHGHGHHDHDLPGEREHDEQDAPPGDHDPHDATDHLLPACAGPAPAPTVLACLAAPWSSTLWAPREPPVTWVPPRDELPPAGDPPPTSSPRAPPVG